MSDRPAKKIVLYHGNCYDGTASAMLFVAQYPSASLYPVVYNAPLPNAGFEDADVYLLDFSVPLEQLLNLAATARTVTVIDHHTRAREHFELLCELQVLDEPGVVFRGQFSNISFIVSKRHSGAWLTWRFLHGAEAHPDWVLWVSDRDTFTFQYPSTRAFNEGLGTIKNDPYTWMDEFKHHGVDHFVEVGKILLDKTNTQLDYLFRTAVRWVQLAGHRVPMVECPKFFASDACARLYNEYPEALFAIATYHENGRRCYSLRSAKLEDGAAKFDVDLLCRQYGGGGHPTAAGFSLPEGDEDIIC